MSDSPESDLTTDGPSTGTSTSDEDADDADAPERDVTPDPEPTSTHSSKSDTSTESDGKTDPVSSGGIANPPNMDATETSQPSNESSSSRTSEPTFESLSDGGEDTNSGGDDSGLLSGGGGVSMATITGFGLLTAFCLVIALAVLWTIQSHGMIHAPIHLWAAFYGALLAPLVVALGGAGVASIFSSANQMAPDKNTRHSNQNQNKNRGQ